MKQQSETHEKVKKLTLIWQHEKDSATPLDTGWQLAEIKIDDLTITLIGESFPQ